MIVKPAPILRSPRGLRSKSTVVHDLDTPRENGHGTIRCIRLLFSLSLVEVSLRSVAKGLLVRYRGY